MAWKLTWRASAPNRAACTRQLTSCNSMPRKVCLGRIELAALRRHFHELVALQNRDCASLQVNPTLFGPGAQLLVRALARSADNLADLALRDRDCARRRGGLRLLRQPEQRFCQSARQIEEGELLHLLGRAAQPRAEYL